MRSIQVCQVHLAVIDGIKNARGSEGVWNGTFRLVEDRVLSAGLNPVSPDSVAVYIMGNNPELEKPVLPAGGQCDNYPYLLDQKGLDPNRINEIEIVGDRAELVTQTIPQYEDMVSNDIQLLQNYRNPFTPSAIIKYYLPQSENLRIKIISSDEREVETLLNGIVPAGHHELH